MTLRVLRLYISGAGVDRLGVYLYAQRLGQAGEVVRVAFLRPVIDDRDARSSLTLMAQLAWERERSYIPVSSRDLSPHWHYSGCSQIIDEQYVTRSHRYLETSCC